MPSGRISGGSAIRPSWNDERRLCVDVLSCQQLPKIAGARTLVGWQAVRNHFSGLRIAAGSQDGCLADEMLGNQFPDGREAGYARAGALAPHRDTLLRCGGCQPLREQIVCHRATRAVSLRCIRANGDLFCTVFSSPQLRGWQQILWQSGVTKPVLRRGRNLGLTRFVVPSREPFILPCGMMPESKRRADLGP